MSLTIIPPIIWTYLIHDPWDLNPLSNGESGGQGRVTAPMNIPVIIVGYNIFGYFNTNCRFLPYQEDWDFKKCH